MTFGYLKFFSSFESHITMFVVELLAPTCNKCVIHIESFFKKMYCLDTDNNVPS